MSISAFLFSALAMGLSLLVLIRMLGNGNAYVPLRIPARRKKRSPDEG
jgi:hypothetical protein